MNSCNNPRHRCKNVCCTENHDAQCLIPCGAKLSCKEHSCPEACHFGRSCLPCMNITWTELSCRCGSHFLMIFLLNPNPSWNTTILSQKFKTGQSREPPKKPSFTPHRMRRGHHDLLQRRMPWKTSMRPLRKPQMSRSTVRMRALRRIRGKTLRLRKSRVS